MVAREIRSMGVQEIHPNDIGVEGLKKLGNVKVIIQTAVRTGAVDGGGGREFRACRA